MADDIATSVRNLFQRPAQGARDALDQVPGPWEVPVGGVPNPAGMRRATGQAGGGGRSTTGQGWFEPPPPDLDTILRNVNAARGGGNPFGNPFGLPEGQFPPGYLPEGRFPPAPDVNNLLLRALGGQ